MRSMEFDITKTPERMMLPAVVLWCDLAPKLEPMKAAFDRARAGILEREVAAFAEEGFSSADLMLMYTPEGGQTRATVMGQNVQAPRVCLSKNYAALQGEYPGAMFQFRDGTVRWLE